MDERFRVIESARDKRPKIFEILGIDRWLFDPEGPYYIGIVTLTPDMARLLLLPEIAHSNRDRSPAFVNLFAADMKAGMWSPYCSTLSFADMVLTDGQTRGEGVVQSDTAQRFMIVVRPDDDPGIFDQQHKRSFSESEAMKVSSLDEIPRKRRGPLASALVLHRVWALLSQQQFRRVSDQQKEYHFHVDQAETLALHRARQSFEAATFKSLPVAATAGWAAVLEHDRDMGLAFLDRFAVAEKQEESHPAYRLHRWLLSRVTKRSDHTSVQAYYNAVVYCYDAFCAGRSVGNISVPADTFVRPKGA